MRRRFLSLALLLLGLSAPGAAQPYGDVALADR
jgi:hypothetical protein